MQSLKSILGFLVNVGFDLYIYVLIVRLLMQKYGAYWSNPISQTVVKMTNFLVKPTRRIVPGVAGFDLAIVLWMLIFELIEMILLWWINLNAFPNVGGLFVASIAALFMKLIYVYIASLVLGALMSWFPRLQGGPLSNLVNLLTTPLLRPFRRFVPMFGGLDLTPMIAIIILYLLNMYVFAGLVNLGISMAAT